VNAIALSNKKGKHFENTNSWVLYTVNKPFMENFRIISPEIRLYQGFAIQTEHFFLLVISKAFCGEKFYKLLKHWCCQNKRRIYALCEVIKSASAVKRLCSGRKS
jgi:hypothetical protein